MSNQDGNMPTTTESDGNTYTLRGLIPYPASSNSLLYAHPSRYLSPRSYDAPMPSRWDEGPEVRVASVADFCRLPIPAGYSTLSLDVYPDAADNEACIPDVVVAYRLTTDSLADASGDEVAHDMSVLLANFMPANPAASTARPTPWERLMGMTHH